MEEMKNTKKLTDDCDAAIKTAQFRFALIAPLVQGLVCLLYTSDAADEL